MTEGIEVRHQKGCATRRGRRCNCDPTYRASVWSNREGRRIRQSFTGKGAGEEAKQWRADALLGLRQGTLRAPSPLTVSDAARAFVAGAEAGTIRDRSGRPYKPSTVRTYREKLDGYVIPELGEHKLSELRRADVQALADELLGSGLSPSSVRNTLDPLRAIYRHAIRRDQVTINPTADLDLPSSRRKPTRIATAVEGRALLDALPSSDRALWATAFYAGLRRGELRALRWFDVDLGRSEIRVERSWDQYEGPIDPKSETSSRTLPILAVLRDHLDAHKIATGRDDSDLVFGRTATDAFVASTVRNRAIAAWKNADADERDPAEEVERKPRVLRPITLHECRHTFASLLIVAGENPKAVQTFMGHSTITVTFDLYGHLFPGSRDEARTRMDAYLEAELSRGTAVGQ